MTDKTTDNRGHIWLTLKENGKGDSDEVDHMAYESGDYHSGPLCKVCGYGYCDLCDNTPPESCDTED